MLFNGLKGMQSRRGNFGHGELSQARFGDGDDGVVSVLTGWDRRVSEREEGETGWTGAGLHEGRELGRGWAAFGLARPGWSVSIFLSLILFPFLKITITFK